MVASLLPNGKQQFLDSNGDPLAGGSVFFYVPTTTTFKTTWKDPDQTVANANPVLLDAAGEAVIYGSGQYRQVVKDVFGNTIWDELTADPLASTGIVPIFPNVAAAEAYSPATAPLFIQTAGNRVAGDEGGTLYKKVAAEPSHLGRLSITLSDGTTVVWYEIVANPIYTAMLGADFTISTDQTAIVQAAINAAAAIAPLGTPVFNNRGVKFYPNQLVFPMRGELVYISDDDLYQNPETTRAAGELVDLVFGANNGGIVNEFVYEAPYNPGLILDVEKAYPGQDQWLGSGQERIPSATSSAKATFLIQSERVGTFAIESEEYGPPFKSPLDGISLYAFKREMTITVDATAGFAGQPGQKIQGLTSGAFGYWISQTATTVLIDWQYGEFEIGEQLYDFSTAVRPVVSNAVMTLVNPGQHQWFSPRGNITWGVYPGDAITDFSFGGRVLLSKTYNYGEESLETAVDPTLVFCRDVRAAPSLGKQIALTASSGLTMRNSTALAAPDLAYMGQLTAFALFSDNGSAAGTTSRTRGGTGTRGGATGTYVFTFNQPMLSTDYMPIVGSLTPDYRAVITGLTTTTVEYTLYGYNNTTALWAAHSATLLVMGQGG